MKKAEFDNIEWSINTSVQLNGISWAWAAVKGVDFRKRKVKILTNLWIPASIITDTRER